MPQLRRERQSHYAPETGALQARASSIGSGRGLAAIPPRSEGLRRGVSYSGSCVRSADGGGEGVS